MGRSKYPSLGILDALYRLTFGFSNEYSKQGLYESLPSERPSRTEYSKMLYSLRHNGYVTYNEITLSFTKKGEQQALLRDLRRITLKNQSDGHARLIAFDIPEKMRQARDFMRSKLKDFKCIKVQKSLYMTPFMCEKEIMQVSKVLKIEKHVHVFKLAK